MCILLVVLCLASACSTYTSGLNIPGKQTFILGEYNDKNYTATLFNTSHLPLVVNAINKNTGEVILHLELMPEDTRKMYVNKDEMVYIKNENDISAKINVRLNRGVEGMRYVDIQSLR